MKKIRICTYNIWHAELVKEDVGAVGRALSEMGAEIVGLQEVDVGTSRMNGMDTLAIIAKAGGYPYYAFSKALDLGGGGYGTAILSRYPIESFVSAALPRTGDTEPRAYGHAVINADGVRIDFINTHTSYESVAARTPQLAELARLCRDRSHLILTADLNTEDLEELSVFEKLTTVNPKRFASFYPRRIAIDHILLSDAFSVTDAQMPMLEMSDHYPVWADVELK